MRARTRTAALMIVLAVLFVWLGWLVAGRQGALIALVVAGLMNFFGYWFSDKLILKHYKAQAISPDHPSGLYQSVEKLAGQGNLPMPKVFIIPQPSPNAFATGRNPKNAAVAATEGIMQLLDRDELEGVMAHELTHVKNRDTLTSTIAATFAGALTFLGQMARFGGASRGRSSRQTNPLGAIFLMIGAPLAGLLLRSMISRVREYAADAGGAGISGKPLGLANALRKISSGARRLPIQNGNPTHSHLFIINPFAGGIQRLFSTHPPVEERIRRLETMAHR